MSAWENFECECTEYLNKNFGSLARFTHAGKSDSTVADILVTPKTAAPFYIEAKHCPAQCGQFVLLPDISRQAFYYSSDNETPINDYSRQIVDHMNLDFEAFANAGTRGKAILMANGTALFSSWIVDYYKRKNVKYFMTNGNALIPVTHFSDYFTPTAVYRVKRSGSANVGQANLDRVLTHLKQSYPIRGYTCDRGKLFVTAAGPMNGERFFFQGYEYMFSLRDSLYEIRRLANTFHANVIFSISLKAPGDGTALQAFIADLS